MLDLREPISRWGRWSVATPARAASPWSGRRIADSVQLWWSRHTPLRLSHAICAATAEILFLRGWGTGILLLTVMWLQPAVLLLGLTGVWAAVAFGYAVQWDGWDVGTRQCRVPADDCRGTRHNAVHTPKPIHDYPAPLLFNPLLAGLSVGYLFHPSPAAVFLAAIAGILAFLLTWVLSHILRTFLWLPVLSLPFIVVSWVVHLAAFRYAGLDHAILPEHTYTVGWPLPLEGFFRTLGLIFFLPNVWVGVAVAALLLINSRIQFVLAVASYALGTTLRGVLTGTFVYVYYDPAALNFILVALAVGGYYLLPSPRSYGLAAIAVGLTAILSEAVSVFWTAVGLPVHALPYNVVTLMMLYVLGLAGSRLLVRVPQASPERTLDYEITARRRYQGSGRAIALPFSGAWSVWQGVDGAWTHQGAWRYAYDFVIQDQDGQTHRGYGSQLSDYYAFQKPVLSPVRGWVVRVVDDLPDAPIGTVDTDHNWGNHVVLYDERGFYVEISHFAQHSIGVKVGDRIERGRLLGRCGNSGYSPQPHIHIQAQLLPDVGAASIPFSFANLLINGEFHAEASPAEHTVLSAVTCDRALGQSFTLPLDTQWHFQVNQRGKTVGQLTLTNRMAVDGSFYFDSGKAKLYYSCDLDGLICHRLEGHDPALALLMVALPKLPLARQPGYQWQDYLPISLVTQSWRRMVYQFASSIYPRLASASYTAQWQADSLVVGCVTIPGQAKPLATTVKFDHHCQLIQVSVGDRTLVRQPE